MASGLYCNLCGCALVDSGNSGSQNRYVHSWVKYFRAIYSSLAGTYVSGVGLYDVGVTRRCIAPLEYTARWNDPGYTFPQEDEIGVLNRKPVNGRYGFVFHEACWSLLEQSFYPEQVPIVQLYEVCRSLPIPTWWQGGGWGYTFGGHKCIDNHGFDFWKNKTSPFDSDQNQRLSPWAKDLCVVLEIKSLLEETPDDQPLEACPSWPASGSDDLFSIVPQEIRDNITSRLPTADVCRLRLASKAFVYTFSSQQFWRSRFQKGGERAWLGEIRGLPKVSNWRWLYRRTSPALLPPALLNRQRVSGLINQIQEILRLKWNESAGLSLVSQVSATRWREVSADLRPCPGLSRFDFDKGYREFHTRSIHIAEHLAQISFSILVLNRISHVTGMRVTAADGTALSIGYSSDQTWCSASVTSLNGFKLAIGTRGVQGIQVIHGDGTASQWFGSPDRAPRTHRLVCSKGISALEAGFDGFKMVRLAVQEAAQSVTVEPNHEKSLLHTALWYPDVPTHGLHLTDAQNGAPRTAYAPLLWVSFGGPAGIKLRQLRGISVQGREYNLIRGIKLNFEENVPNERSHVLGVYSLRRDDLRITNFTIDGPGGEIIEKVRMSEGGDPRMGGVEITTNRGRSFCFGGFESNSPECKTLDIPVGNTITGFYANYSLASGLTGIGVISELVDSH